MELPVRIDGDPQRQPVISVDGAWAAPGLNLSHWPGNRTPRALAHELSTGIALNFARLERAKRDELASGCVAIVNNHYDTDGACSLFAVRHPELALPRERALLAAAAAGDFFAWPDDDAYRTDLIVGALPDPERSPIAERLAGLGDRARHQLATEFLLEHLPAILDGDFATYRTTWEAELARSHAERSQLEQSARDDVAHLDWTTWVARESSTPFEPGRHVLLGSTEHDRVLVAAPTPGGVLYRLVIGTRSWFDMQGRVRGARPSLAALARELNELEGSADLDAIAWRAQPADSPSPELWFGKREQPFFAERSAALAPSTLDLVRVRRAVAEAFRVCLDLPE